MTSISVVGGPTLRARRRASRLVSLRRSCGPCQSNPAQYNGLIIPGGRAPEYIRLEESLPKIVRHFFEENKPVGAICHAAQVLSIAPDLMKGREYTAYIACKPDVTACGATLYF